MTPDFPAPDFPAPDFPAHRALDRCATRLAVASILALAALALTHCLRWLAAGAPIA